MNVLECIKTRRSCRSFSKAVVEDKILEQVIEAGRFAPSGGNSQTVHFMVITNEQVLDELAALVQQEFSKMEIYDGMYGSLINSIRLSKKGGYRFHYDPYALIVVANKKTYGNAMADSSCALENMMIACNELELGSCWINQLHWLDENPVINEYMCKLGLAGDETICGALSVGYANRLNRTVTERTGNPITYIR